MACSAGLPPGRRHRWAVRGTCGRRTGRCSGPMASSSVTPVGALLDGSHLREGERGRLHGGAAVGGSDLELCRCRPAPTLPASSLPSQVDGVDAFGHGAELERAHGLARGVDDLDLDVAGRAGSCTAKACDRRVLAVFRLGRVRACCRATARCSQSAMPPAAPGWSRSGSTRPDSVALSFSMPLTVLICASCEVSSRVLHRVERVLVVELRHQQLEEALLAVGVRDAGGALPPRWRRWCR